MKIELHAKEKAGYYFSIAGELFLLFIAIFALMLFIQRGVVYGEFGPFKILLLLFLPYGFYSVYTSFRMKADVIEFDATEIIAHHFLGNKRYTTAEVSYIDLKSHPFKIEIRLLDAHKKPVVVMPRSKRIFQDLSIIRRAASKSGITSLK